MTCDARIAVIGCGHVGLVMAAGLAELGHDVVGIDSQRSLVAAAVQRRRRHPRARPRRSSSTRGLRGRPPHVHDVVRARHPAGRVHLPRGRHAADAGRRRGPAEHPLGDPVDRGQPQRHDRRSSSTRAPRRSAPARRSRASSSEALAGPRAIARASSATRSSCARAAPSRTSSTPTGSSIGARDRRGRRRGRRACTRRLPRRASSLTDLRTAEMIKYVANSFLATRVSFINEIARLCEHIGVDIDHGRRRHRAPTRGSAATSSSRASATAAAACPRTSPRSATSARRRRRDAGPVRGPGRSTTTQRPNAVRRLRARLGPLEGKTIGVWGLTFKGGTEDTRDSPAMDVVAPAPQRGRRASRPTTRASPSTRPAAGRLHPIGPLRPRRSRRRAGRTRSPS